MTPHVDTQTEHLPQGVVVCDVEIHRLRLVDVALASQHSNANMVKTDFFEAKSTAYAKSTALVDDL